MLTEDRETIDAVLAGDTDRFAELVERYQRRLLGLLWHACNDRELAEDMTQEAFARAYQKLSLYSGQAHFYSWLARLALNVLAGDRRRKRLENQFDRKGFEVAIDRSGEMRQPDEVVEQDEMRQRVHEAIAMLDEDRRTVVLLRDFEQMDYDAIAELLEIPVGTVRSRLHRGRLELRSILQAKATQLGMSGT